MAADAAQARPKKTVASSRAAAEGTSASAGGPNPLGPEPDLKDKHALTVRYMPFVRNIAGRGGRRRQMERVDELQPRRPWGKFPMNVPWQAELSLGQTC